MESNLYIVSFGDSRQYRIEFSGSPEELGESELMKEIEQKARDFIRSKEVEGSHAARFATPEIFAVPRGEESAYTEYPVLDAGALPDIESILLTEVEDMKSVKKLNLNAPYDEHI